MKMMKVVAVAVVVSVLLVIDVQSTTPPPTGQPGLDLTGKMFTLSQENGGVRFYPGSYTPPWVTTRSYTTYMTHRPSTATPLPQTTATPIRGLSVCVRYMAESSNSASIFTLYGLQLTENMGLSYTLAKNYYYWMTMTPKFKLWPSSEWDMWTGVCLTVDNNKSITQLFKDFSMSVRMVMPSRLECSGEPLIEFPGFNGQMTDLQIWDYPLSYKEIFNYMKRGAFRSYRGSLLTWSNISYSNKRNTLLEDEYYVLAGQPMRGRGGGEKRGGRGGRLRKKDFSAEESQQAKGRPII